ncbi:MAG: cupin domain-containing protein [Promethearchaeota archaeon]
MVKTLNVDSCPTVVAPDSTLIRELLNPSHTGIEASIRYSLAHGTILKGGRTHKHRLRSTSETYYILAGKGRISVDEVVVKVRPGSLVYVPPQAMQHVENVGESDLEYLVICDPAWSDHDVEVQ